MDVPLPLNNIGIRHGLQGYKGKSSTFCHKTDVVGLSAFYGNYNFSIGYFDKYIVIK